MDIKFKYKDISLENTEAAALMKATTPQPFEIDLSPLIGVSVVDSQNLFKLSVEQGSSTLAELAFKMASSQKETTKFKVLVDKPKKVTAEKKQLVKTNDAYDIVETLNSSLCYRNIGAALLLFHCVTTNSRAIRDIAIEFVNNCKNEYKIKRTSVVYRGFRLNPDNDLEPIELNSSVKRKDSFHVCPLYIALCSGREFCEENGLLTIRKQYSIGSRKEDAGPQADLMRRMFYSMKLSDKGYEVKQLWGDMETYFTKFFNSRHV